MQTMDARTLEPRWSEHRVVRCWNARAIAGVGSGRLRSGVRSHAPCRPISTALIHNSIEGSREDFGRAGIFWNGVLRPRWTSVFLFKQMDPDYRVTVGEHAVSCEGCVPQSRGLAADQDRHDVLARVLGGIYADKSGGAEGGLLSHAFEHSFEGLLLVGLRLIRTPSSTTLLAL